MLSRKCSSAYVWQTLFLLQLASYVSSEYLVIKYFRPSQTCAGGANSAEAWLCDTCIPRDSGMAGTAIVECDHVGGLANWRYFSDNYCERQTSSATWTLQAGCITNNDIESQTIRFENDGIAVSSSWGDAYAVLTR